MELRVLGPIEIHNGHKLAIGGPRQRRIVAALAMHEGEVLSIDRLVDITWADEDLPKQAERNVRTLRPSHPIGCGRRVGRAVRHRVAGISDPPRNR